jgi:hypothetical protein
MDESALKFSNRRIAIRSTAGDEGRREQESPKRQIASVASL